MDKFFSRAYGFVWIAMIVLFSFQIAEKPSESGMTIGFLIMSLGMVYFHFSGISDPPSKTLTTQQR